MVSTFHTHGFTAQLATYCRFFLLWCPCDSSDHFVSWGMICWNKWKLAEFPILLNSELQILQHSEWANPTVPRQHCHYVGHRPTLTLIKWAFSSLTTSCLLILLTTPLTSNSSNWVPPIRLQNQITRMHNYKPPNIPRVFFYHTWEEERSLGTRLNNSISDILITMYCIRSNLWNSQK